MSLKIDGDPCIVQVQVCGIVSKAVGVFLSDMMYAAPPPVPHAASPQCEPSSIISPQPNLQATYTTSAMSSAMTDVQSLSEDSALRQLVSTEENDRKDTLKEEIAAHQTQNIVSRTLQAWLQT